MASSDAEMDDSNTGSVLTDALRTEALEARSMMPAEFQQPPNDEAMRNWVWVNGKHTNGDRGLKDLAPWD
jgi:hypothetical protein